jgi:hypothetical protein
MVGTAGFEPATPERLRQELVDTQDGMTAVTLELNLATGPPPDEIADSFMAQFQAVASLEADEGPPCPISASY